MKKILVPIDFSEKSEYAARAASDVARETGASLFLLHMLDLPVGVIDPAKSSSNPATILYLDRASEKFESFKKSSFFKGVKLEQTIQFHKAHTGIIDVSDQQEVDLIVMGAVGTSGIEEMLIGSTTEKVVRKAKMPVLVIKNEIDLFLPKNIVFASDFLKDKASSFKKIMAFSKVFKAKLHLLKINTVQNFESTIQSNSLIQEFVEETQVDNYTTNIYNDVSVESGILNFSRSIKADLIVLNTHQKSGLANLFNGSLSEDLVNHAKLPSLTVRV